MAVHVVCSERWLCMLYALFARLPLGSIVVEMADTVPLCPPGADSPVARHLRISGWQWDEELLLDVVCVLATEDVSDVRSVCLHQSVRTGVVLSPVCRSLSGLVVSDVGESRQWPAEICTFLQRVASFLVTVMSASIMLLVRAMRPTPVQTVHIIQSRSVVYPDRALWRM